MKKILILLFVTAFFFSCERELDSEGVAEGEIAFPSIVLNGPQYQTVVAGSAASYDDPGAAATLGTDEISDQVVTNGTVDLSTPGVYSLTYSVSTTNDLGSESTVSVSRFINVSDGDVSGLDFSGNYLGTGFSGAPVPRPVTSVGTGWFSVDDILGSGNIITGVFAVNSATTIVLPNQPTGFGNINTTSAGTYANITADGWEWVVFIGCCGNFGPITWTKQ